jgi:hypothetical protein
MDPETVMNLTYAGLGLGGLSFVGTFFGKQLVAGLNTAAAKAASGSCGSCGRHT